MRELRATRAPHFLLAVFGFVVFTSGCDSAAVAQPSLIPSLEVLKPTIECVNEALSESAILQCVQSLGISENFQQPDQPKTAEEFSQLVVLTWAGLMQGAESRLSTQQFDQAIQYASCVEHAAIALEGLEVEGDPQNAIRAGQAKVETACSDHFLSTRSLAVRNPGLLRSEVQGIPEVELKAHLLGQIFASSAYRYVIEANGWVTDRMRSCVRYADGRPPSVGCEGRTLPRVAPPPPISISSSRPQ